MFDAEYDTCDVITPSDVTCDVTNLSDLSHTDTKWNADVTAISDDQKQPNCGISALLLNLQKLQQTSKLTDVKIICADGLVLGMYYNPTHGNSMLDSAQLWIIIKHFAGALESKWA